uniref:Uncharacterized protein n=1 Tax=Romanomermis culicivorax TaxID=13658 RepID=A0A915JY93_ROMCU
MKLVDGLDRSMKPESNVENGNLNRKNSWSWCGQIGSLCNCAQNSNLQLVETSLKGFDTKKLYFFK